MTKRDYGSGSIAEVRPGVFRLRVSAGADVLTGKPRVVSETFRGTRKEAQRRLGLLAAQHGGQRATSGTLGELVAHALAVLPLARGTLSNYERARDRIPERLARTPISRISAADLNAVYAALGKSGHGPDAVRQVHALISRALTLACSYGWLPANPARSARPPRLPRSGVEAAPPDALRRLLAATDDQQTRLWLTLTALTGARRSEVLALRWSNVDGSTVTIAGSLEVDGAPKATKSGRVRSVAVDAETAAMLRAWRTAQKERALAAGARLARDPYVLSDEVDSGRPWRPDLATKRFAKLAAKAGLPGLHLHMLRHGHVTELLAAGVDVATVARRVGHARVSTTVDMYAHTVADRDRAAADVARARAGGGK